MLSIHVLPSERVSADDEFAFDCPYVRERKSNEGRQIQTAKKYGFDSLYFYEVSLDVNDNYVRLIRPLLQPKCDYLLLNRNWIQFQKLKY